MFFVPGQRLRSLSLSTPHASTLISILSRQPFLFCTLCSSTSGREESSRSFADRCLLLTPFSLPHRGMSVFPRTMESGSGTREIEGGGYFGEGTNERTNERSASHVARTISPGTQCGSRSWAEIIRFECTLAAAVGNSVISGHPAYNGYHNGIKHNASINVNNNRAPAGVTGRVDGASERASERAPNVQGAHPSSLHSSTRPEGVGGVSPRRD